RQLARVQTVFVNGTVGGNGRTCATCHPLNHDFTIDADFIATLPPTDPLFLAESGDPNLPPLERDMNGAVVDATIPAFEDSVLMRARGLILENIDGLGVNPMTEKLLRPPVFRAVPALFNMQFTAPLAVRACCRC